MTTWTPDGHFTEEYKHVIDELNLRNRKDQEKEEWEMTNVPPEDRLLSEGQRTRRDLINKIADILSFDLVPKQIWSDKAYTTLKDRLHDHTIDKDFTAYEDGPLEITYIIRKESRFILSNRKVREIEKLGFILHSIEMANSEANDIYDIGDTAVSIVFDEIMHCAKCGGNVYHGDELGQSDNGNDDFIAHKDCNIIENDYPGGDD